MSFVKPEDFKGAYCTGDSKVPVVPLPIAIEVCNAKRDEALEEARRHVVNLLSLIMVPDDTWKPHHEYVRANAKEWLKKHGGEK